jgi:hypothetical protein
VGTSFLTVNFQRNLVTYFIARIFTGSLCFWQLILNKIWFPKAPLGISVGNKVPSENILAGNFFSEVISRGS